YGPPRIQLFQIVLRIGACHRAIPLDSPSSMYRLGFLRSPERRPILHAAQRGVGIYQTAGLDLKTLVWTRGFTFPLNLPGVGCGAAEKAAHDLHRPCPTNYGSDLNITATRRPIGSSLLSPWTSMMTSSTSRSPLSAASVVRILRRPIDFP